jgi:Arc/MetJ family transcription regulator
MKTVIDIDDKALRAAQRALGTATKKDTVNQALAEVAAIAARRRFIERVARGSLADLGDEAITTAAWQR